MKKTVISLEQSENEIRDFIYFHDELQSGKLDEEGEVDSKYPNLVHALRSGLLVIDENKNPVYTLKKPIGEGELGISKVEFKTRIKPLDSANISKGLDISKNQMEYILRCYCYLTGLPKNALDNLSKYDYKVIEQICTLFL